jgi:transcriptional regulator with XRE-family HTH domain
MNIGTLLKYQRKVKNMTLGQVGKRANLSYSYLKKIEKGERNVCNISTIEKLSKGYNLSVWELFYFAVNEKPLSWLQKLILKIGGKK